MTLHSRIPEIAKHLDDAVDDALSKGAHAVAESARARVAVDTGALKRAIHVEREGENEYVVVAGDREAFYGHIVEGGSVNGQPPRPFLMPAFEMHKAAMVKAVALALTRLAEKGR